MNSYKNLNLYTGWILWAIAFIVYIVTIEPSLSFWDCGEFISTGYTLQIGHPPGAPFYLLLARFFSIFAGNNVQHVAFAINLVSVFASAFTILFLFWTTTHISKKIVNSLTETSEKLKNILVIGSGAMAALTFTFTDTFWNSAVEAEVYSLSSLFTAVLFWAILRWESEAKNKNSTRWLLLIAFLLGLSIGVHVLTILVIPALVMVYYFTKNTPTFRGGMIAFVIGIAIVGLLIWIIIPGIPKLAFWNDLLFVNTLGLPINSGFVIFIILLFGILVYGLYYTHSRSKSIANTIILGFTVFIIGYSSYGILIIRSMAQPPINENNPENAYNLLSYINRDQYSKSPLLYGNTYNAPIEKFKNDKQLYAVIDGKYVATHTTKIPVYNSEFSGFFPRMWSNQQQHVDAYKQWANIQDGVNTQTLYVNGQTLQRPSFMQNLQFFVSYQLSHMYLRYFMWNFSGRQNDIQGNGEPHKGNWISGIWFLDNARLGAQDALPDMYIQNKGHNIYFMLPFLLGLAGLFYSFKKSYTYSLSVLLLFVFTGIAIAVFLNQTPLQARERDYAFLGSFYAFSIFIGIGFLALYSSIKKYFPKAVLPVSITIAALCPIVLAGQNWNDHNRSERYVARDFSRNYLESCAPNAIIFTYGDNDTFPLWYLQQVEGIRTDVRVVNVSLLNMDWYINQLKQQQFSSQALPISLPQSKYINSTNDQIFVLAHSNIAHIPYPIKDIIQLVASNDTLYKARRHNGELVDYIPVPTLVIPINKKMLTQKGIVAPTDTMRILPGVVCNTLTQNSSGLVTDSILSKSELIILDILANFNWERPIYFSAGMAAQNYMNLHNNLFLEGVLYKLQPMQAQNNSESFGEVSTDFMYKNIMQKYSWGNIEKQQVYIDQNIRDMAIQYRDLFSNLAQALIAENKKNKAREVLDKCEQLFPNSRIPYEYFSIKIANNYAAIGDSEKANTIYMQIMNSTSNNFLYYMSVRPNKKSYIYNDVMQDINIATELFEIANNAGNKVFAKSIASSTSAFFEQYFSFTHQVSLCKPEQFEQYNSWVFQLTGDLPYIAYWYNAMKVFIMSNNTEI